ncbi:ketohexokinase [Drosophila sulfurigaster albostrigata]|uniref:ketohexokinase n=1 Tax=Drosophila sulfurigaster albostrigata TaxID=89887 RepID=UPI002D21E097|nr:ketohexokinase [Drosophila sulfurigaster albostrigata]
MKKQIIKEFITIKKVRRLPPKEPPAEPPVPRRVLVVGRCTLDMITVCDDHPSPGVTQRTEEGFWRLGGHAANTCCVLRRLGTECEFLGQLSSIGAFEHLLSSFHAMGIDISSCPRTAHDPPHQSIVVVRGQETRTTVEYSKRKHELTFQQFVGAVDYRKYSWIHFEARHPRETLRMMQAVRDYNARNEDANIIVSVNLANKRPLGLLLANMADYVIVHHGFLKLYGYMNGREAVWAVRERLLVMQKRWLAKKPKITPSPNPDEQQLDHDCAPPVRKQPTIIYENYEQGASCLMADDRYFKVGGQQPQKIEDTIGEHDTFVGAFIYALQEIKLSLRDALEYGTRATSHKITQFGFDCLRCMPKDLISCYYA